MLLAHSEILPLCDYGMAHVWYMCPIYCVDAVFEKGIEVRID